MRAGDARDEFHAKEGCGATDRFGERGRSFEGLHESDDDGVGFETGLFVGAGHVDDGENVGVREDPAPVVGEGGSGFGVGLVVGSGGFACSGFDGDGEALSGEGFEAFREERDAGLAGCGLFEDAEDHGCLRCAVGQAGHVEWGGSRRTA